MHLQRALLLFAVVLGLAALAASVSRTDRTRSNQPPLPNTTTDVGAPAPDPGSRVIRFGQGPPRETRSLPVRTAATVLVAVKQAGQAEIPGIGASSNAEPDTPASFEVFPSRPGRFTVVFRPAAGSPTETVGTLRVRPR